MERTPAPVSAGKSLPARPRMHSAFVSSVALIQPLRFDFGVFFDADNLGRVTKWDGVTRPRLSAPKKNPKPVSRLTEMRGRRPVD